MIQAMEVLKNDPSSEFTTAFPRVKGIFDREACIRPQKTYTVQEINELLDHLYCIWINDRKKPQELQLPGNQKNNKIFTPLV